jgi:hypothetical protein
LERGILSPKIGQIAECYKPLILRKSSLLSRASSFSQSWQELGRIGLFFEKMVTKWLQF